MQSLPFVLAYTVPHVSNLWSSRLRDADLQQAHSWRVRNPWLPQWVGAFPFVFDWLSTSPFFHSPAFTCLRCRRRGLTRSTPITNHLAQSQAKSGLTPSPPMKTRNLPVNPWLTVCPWHGFCWATGNESRTMNQTPLATESKGGRTFGAFQTLFI